MPALIPQQRPDKNNKIVTRWVKPDSGAPSSLGKLPTPGVGSESLQSKQKRLFDSFDFGRMSGSESYKENIRKQLAPMTEQAVTAALNTLDEYQDSPRVNYAVLHSINSWSKNEKSEQELLTSFRFAAIESVYEKYLKPSPLGNPQRASEVEEGVRSSLLVRANDDNFENVPKRPLTEEESDQAVIAGYAAATLELHGMNISKDRFMKSDYWSLFQDHGELVGVFEEFKERMDEVVDYVYHNGPDAGAARQHMRGDHMALSDGAL